MVTQEAPIINKSEITLQQATDVLNVSQAFLHGLLEHGEIPCCNMGEQCSVLLEDVLAYKQRIDAARLKALDELTAQAQELNMGY